MSVGHGRCAAMTALNSEQLTLLEEENHTNAKIKQICRFGGSRNEWMNMI